MNTPEPKTVISLIFLTLGAVLSFYIASDTWPDNDGPRRPELSLVYYLNDAEMTGTGPDGNILYQVWTDHAAQAPEGDHIEMDKVRMVYGPPTALPWELEARSGRIPEDTSVIELTGDVVAISANEGEPPTIIRTQRLDIDPATREATTTEKVELEFGGRVLYATGMRANLETNELQLLSNVNGKFIP